MGKALDIDALQRLINAVSKYEGELSTNRAIMSNAANLCSQAMGNDVLSQKHIQKLNDAIKSLDAAIDKAGSVLAALQYDLAMAKEVADSGN